MVLEAIAAWIYGLPHWLSAVVEIMIVALVFMTFMTLLAGIWIGLRIIGVRMKSIHELQFVPPKITFDHDDNGNTTTKVE